MPSSDFTPRADPAGFKKMDSLLDRCFYTPLNNSTLGGSQLDLAKLVAEAVRRSRRR